MYQEEIYQVTSLVATWKKDFNKQRADRAVEYINEVYSIKKFLVDVGVIPESYTSNAVVCLANDDKTPSMKINYNTNQFNCFSCGNSGNYISMVVHYKKDVLKEYTTYYDEIENILRSDVQMQIALGFNSIIKREKMEINTKLTRRPLNKKPIITRRYLNDKYKSIEDKIAVINLAQFGYDFEKIEEIMSGTEEKKSVNIIEDNILGVL